ncbi:hypothetical protein J8I29_24320 [Labrys sp. LIt4]|uniref:hypothetical protein n=1 Tax=Labrys sp. LIt4 TaxID=2821355 RepID=UPI001ADF1F41|nr:hypothetical protein [Labrys sp. LIt4]MBP0582475.1 hypothetical protein [Labrys sp. LIt4]
MSGEKLYIIGDRGAGVILLKTNPLRVVEVSDDEITRYSKAIGEDGYAKVAASLWRLVSDIKSGQESGGGVDATRAIGVQSLVESGIQLTDVDFVFAARAGVAATRRQAIPQGARTEQGQGSPQSQQAQQGVAVPESQQAQQGLAMPESQQAHQGQDAPEAQQGLAVPESQQAQQGHDAPQALNAHQGQQGHQGVYPPLQNALKELFGDAGTDLKRAVLSDEPNK